MTWLIEKVILCHFGEDHQLAYIFGTFGNFITDKGKLIYHVFIMLLESLCAPYCNHAPEFLGYGEPCNPNLIPKVNQA